MTFLQRGGLGDSPPGVSKGSIPFCKKLKCFFSNDKWYHTSKQTNKMSTIHVLTEKLKGGYQPILDFYNQNKPAEWTELQEAGVCEGGFECDLPIDELVVMKMSRYSDKNNLVQQVRWSQGKLLSMGYKGLGHEQTELLFRALQNSLGADQVEMV